MKTFLFVVICFVAVFSCFAAPVSKCPLLESNQELEKLHKYCVQFENTTVPTKLEASTRNQLLCLLFLKSYDRACLKNVQIPTETSVVVNNLLTVCSNSDLLVDDVKELKEFIHDKLSCTTACIDLNNTENAMVECNVAFYLNNLTRTSLVSQTKPVVASSTNDKPQQQQQTIEGVDTKANVAIQIQQQQQQTNEAQQNDKQAQTKQQQSGVAEGQQQSNQPTNADEKTENDKPHEINEGDNQGQAIGKKPATNELENQQQPAVPQPDAKNESPQNNPAEQVSGSVKDQLPVPDPKKQDVVQQSDKVEAAEENKPENPEQLPQAELNNGQSDSPFEGNDDTNIANNNADLDNSYNDDDYPYKQSDPNNKPSSNVEKTPQKPDRTYNSPINSQTATVDGYHNKQKIRAIVLEGPRGRRQHRNRRPNSANYHKLDSNLEEAITSSTANKSSSHVIY